MVTTEYETEQARKQDSKPKIKVEFIDLSNNTTDISAYYLSGAQFEQIKERAPDEIQAGNFDIELSNQDDTFSEYQSGSLLEGLQYHGAKIKIYLGFVLPDGTTEYDAKATGIIDQITTTGDQSIVTFRCRDTIQRLLDTNLHLRPSAEVPAANSGNTGNGTITKVDTKPFKTVNELWTLTCTLGGADGVAEFSVVGATSGDVGDATSGTEFSTGTGAGGIKFKIKGGGTNWVAGDIFTFTTTQYPEWDGINPAKIIWSILTGYNYDGDVQEDWSDLVLGLDSTQSDANTDVDYDSFVAAISDLSGAGEATTLAGYVPYDTNTATFLENLILLFLGSLFTDADGRVSINTWVPTFGEANATLYADSLKVVTLGYIRTVDEVINHITVNFKKNDIWQFSDETIIYDGVFVDTDSTSIGKYGRLSLDFKSIWYSTSENYIESFARRIVLKFAEPPLSIDFETGLDAVNETLGNNIRITDTKYGFADLPGEISRVTLMFDKEPKKVGIRMRRDSDTDVLWGFLGSSDDEGDSESPQSSSWDSATTSDKQFTYIGQSGQTSPDYKMF